MKKWVLVLGLSASSIASLNAWADCLGTGGDCSNDGCQWCYDASTKTLTISGTGNMDNYGINEHIPDFSVYERPWDGIASNVEHIVISSGIETIGNGAFRNMYKVKTIDIPDSVTKIEGYAFYNTIGVENITIPNSVNSIEYAAFYGMTGLTNLEIPNSVTSIGDYAFRAVKNVANLEIPDSVTSIGEYAFSVMDNLTSITIGNSVSSLGTHAFANTGKLEKIYCQGKERCEALLSQDNNNANRINKLVISEPNPDGSISIYQAGQFVGFKGKRIYTIDEANQVAGKVNRISIKYR